MGYLFDVLRVQQLAFYTDPYNSHTSGEGKGKGLKISTLEAEEKHSEI